MFKKELRKTKDREIKISYSWKRRPEQEQVMNTIISEQRRSWLIEMKTWRWKTHVIMSIAEYFDEPILIAVHSIGTLEDMYDSFVEVTWYEPWRYYSSKKEIKDITITTHDSFVEKAELFRWKFWIIIIDECDYNLSSNMIETILVSDCDWIFWFSWTPTTKELDIASMEHIFWLHIKVLDQENNWYNILPDIVQINYKSDRNYSFWANWADVITQLVEDEKRFNDQCTYIRSKMKDWSIKFWLLLVERRDEECVKFYNELSKDINCFMINGKTKVKDDKTNINEMEKAWSWLIIWTVRKVWRGKDIPMIDWVFLFFPNTFLNNTVQAVGRWLRLYEWKPKCLLMDWCDTPLLDFQKKARIKTYKSEYTEDVKIDSIQILSVSNPNELFN